MRTVIRIPAMQPVRTTVRLGRRPANTLVVLGILSLATPIATWQGVPSSIVVPAAVTAGLVVLFLGVRRALRKASGCIDSILREELGASTGSDRELAKFSSIPTQSGSMVNECVELERRQGMVDDHRRRAYDARPVARAGLDDAQLGGGKRQ